MNTIDKLLQLKPTDLEEVRAALNEAITELRREAEEKLASLQSDPKAAGSVKEAMLTIEDHRSSRKGCGETGGCGHENHAARLETTAKTTT